MLIVALYCRSLLSGIHHAYQVKGTVGSGNASWIRVFGPEPYRTVLTRTAQWKRAIKVLDDTRALCHMDL